MAEVRERVLWRGKVCTVTERQGGKVRLRDPYGFDVGFVAKRQTEPLREDDDQKNFTVRRD